MQKRVIAFQKEGSAQSYSNWEERGGEGITTGHIILSVGLAVAPLWCWAMAKIDKQGFSAAVSPVEVTNTCDEIPACQLHFVRRLQFTANNSINLEQSCIKH